VKEGSRKFFVIPAEAGIQENLWTLAFAGVTDGSFRILLKISFRGFHVPL